LLAICRTFLLHQSQENTMTAYLISLALIGLVIVAAADALS